MYKQLLDYTLGLGSLAYELISITNANGIADIPADRVNKYNSSSCIDNEEAGVLLDSGFRVSHIKGCDETPSDRI